MRGLVPAGAGVGCGRIRWADSLYQTTTPAFPTFVYPQQPAFAIRTKACPRTPIRDVPSNQPRCRLPTGEPRRIVDPWSMARKEECSAGACPPLGPGSGVAESAVPIRCTKPHGLRLFRPSLYPQQPAFAIRTKACPGLRYLGCAIQSTSMPAPHRRTPPNCRPMVDWPEKKNVVRGLVPRWGLGVGRSGMNPPGPTRLTRPQLRLFRPSCTRSSRLLRFVRKHVPGLRSGMCPPINLDAGSPPANPAEL